MNMANCSHKILVIYSVATVDRFCLVSDGNRCVIYTSFIPEQDYGFSEGSTSFNLDEERKKRYLKVEKALEVYLNDKENILGKEYFSYTSLKVAFLPNNEENQKLLDLGPKFLSTIRDVLESANYYDYKDIAYYIAYFLPSKELWPYQDIGSEEQVKSKVENELLNIKVVEPPTLKEDEYGSYPQDMVKDQTLIDKLNKLIKEDSWQGYGFNAADYQGDYMLYCDTMLDNIKYRAVLIKEFRPNDYGENIARNELSSQIANGFEKDHVYWFKYMPIKWYVIDHRYISKKILDVGAMSNAMMHNLGHDFSYDYDSLILPWLNEDFDKVAFESANKRMSAITILSMEEYRKYLPAKELRRPQPTDYALIKGFLNQERHHWYSSFVWTSTYLPFNNRMVSIAFDGTIIDQYNDNYGFITYVIGGIQPTFIDLSKH